MSSWPLIREIGFERLQQLVADLADRYPGLADFLEAEGEDTLTCLNFPPQHQKRIRTTNGLERFNQEIKRRTRIVLPHLPQSRIGIAVDRGVVHGAV